MRRMVDQRVEAEFGDAAFQQVLEARLGEAKPFGGGGLRDVPTQHGFVDGDHQFGAGLHVGGLGF